MIGDTFPSDACHGHVNHGHVNVQNPRRPIENIFAWHAIAAVSCGGKWQCLQAMRSMRHCQRRQVQHAVSSFDTVVT
jgi:hypothetical protein